MEQNIRRLHHSSAPTSRLYHPRANDHFVMRSGCDLSTRNELEMIMSVPVWAVLAVATWTIAILILGVGMYRWSLILAGKAELKSFPGDEPHGSPLYRRAVRAHANCVENLPVFA